MKVLGALVAIIALSAMSASAAQATKFTSANYPATATGSSTADVFDAFGSTIQCTNNTFTSGSLAAASESLTVNASYKNCSAFGALPATVNMTTCDFLFTTSGKVHVKCTTAGDAIDVNIYASKAAHEEGKAPICIVKIPAQENLGTVTYTNSGSSVIVKGKVEGIKSTQTRNSFLCPAGTETTTAKYTIQEAGITMTGNNGAISVD